jgi:hypothetical protein
MQLPLIPLIHRGTPRRVVSAQAHGDDAYAVHVDIAACGKVIERGAARDLEIVAHAHAAKANRFALTGPIDKKHREAAAYELRRAAQILDFLLRVEPAESHDARFPCIARVFAVNEIGRKRATAERKLDDFDSRAIGQHRKLAEALERDPIRF